VVNRKGWTISALELFVLQISTEHSHVDALETGEVNREIEAETSDTALSAILGVDLFGWVPENSVLNWLSHSSTLLLWLNARSLRRTPYALRIEVEHWPGAASINHIQGPTASLN
jgi:hypothetical protein